MKELLAIQTTLKVPKKNFNKFGGFSYRSAEDILEAVKPLLLQHKCVLEMTEDIIQVGDRIYIKAIVGLKNEDGFLVTSSGHAREPLVKKGMDESQITGSASSYAKKSALSSLFALDDHKDPDAPDAGQEQDAAATSVSEETAQLASRRKKAIGAFAPLNVSVQTLEEYVGTPRDEWTNGDCDKLLQAYQSIVKKTATIQTLFFGEQ